MRQGVYFSLKNKFKSDGKIFAAYVMSFAVALVVLSVLATVLVWLHVSSKNNFSKKLLGRCEMAPPNVPLAEATVEGDVAIYNCVYGYRMKEGVQNNITCGSDGWPPHNISNLCESSPFVIALPSLENLSDQSENTECGVPLNGINTISVVVENTTHLSTYNYSCSTGYITRDSLQVSCLKSGNWSSPPPKCVAVECEKPPEGVNTEAVPENVTTTFSSLFIYQCLEGYTTLDHLGTTCNSSGNWTKPSPKCHAIDCGRPSDGLNTLSVPNILPTTFNSSFSYQCLEGYSTTDKLEVHCLSTGVWCHDPPKCYAVNCGKPFDGENTAPIPDEVVTAFNSSFTYSCLEGYSTTEDVEITCNSTGFWSAQPPKCHAEDCKQPLEGINTVPLPENITATFNSSFIYQCLQGFTTKDDLEVRCNSDGSWSSKPPNCNAIDCGRPSDGLNTLSVPNILTTTFNSSFSYQCLEGYSTTDKLEVHCLSTGVWCHDPPKCYAVDCNQPLEGINTVPLPEDITTTFNSSFTYQCLQGYTTQDDLEVRCSSDSSWSSKPPNCHAVGCGLPPNGENVLLVEDGVNTSFATTYTYRCKEGYINTTELTTKCFSNGTWSNLEPKCEAIKCKLPADGIETEKVPETINTTFSDAYTYQCKPGYGSCDSMTTQCTADGSWSLPPPQCKKRQIGSTCLEYFKTHPEIKDGTCVPFLSIDSSYEVTVNCVKEGDKVLTKIPAAGGRVYRTPSGSCTMQSKIQQPTVIDGITTRYCSEPVNVTYSPSTDEDIFVIVESLTRSNKTKCQQVTRIDCSKGSSHFIPVLQLKSHSTVCAYGADNSKHSTCDCFEETGAGHCSSGCRCAARDRLTDTYDTVTQVLHKNILPYVASVQAVLHTPPGLTDEFGRLKISVGDIECSTPLM